MDDFISAGLIQYESQLIYYQRDSERLYICSLTSCLRWIAWQGLRGRRKLLKLVNWYGSNVYTFFLPSIMKTNGQDPIKYYSTLRLIDMNGAQISGQKSKMRKPIRIFSTIRLNSDNWMLNSNRWLWKFQLEINLIKKKNDLILTNLANRIQYLSVIINKCPNWPDSFAEWKRI